MYCAWRDLDLLPCTLMVWSRAKSVKRKLPLSTPVLLPFVTGLPQKTPQWSIPHNTATLHCLFSYISNSDTGAIPVLFPHLQILCFILSHFLTRLSTYVPESTNVLLMFKLTEFFSCSKNKKVCCTVDQPLRQVPTLAAALVGYPVHHMLSWLLLP